MTVASLVSATRRSIGIYSTAPTAYLSALARVPGFRLEDLDTALGDRQLIRARTMRYSVYTSPPDLLDLTVAATRSLATRMNPWRKRLEADYDRLAAAVEDVLADGPLPATDIRKAVDPTKELGDLFSVLLGLMGAECRIVRATNTGGWRSNRLTYALWQSWVGSPPPRIDAAEARQELARLYVDAYGPVTADDLRWWAGWNVAETNSAVAGVNLAREGKAAGLLDGVRLLPVWDVLMVAYQDRSRLFAAEHSPLFYDRFGNATSVVYDRGRVVGVWELGKKDDPLHIRVAPVGKWPKRRWNEVEEQAQRIASMLGSESLVVERAAQPLDLTKAKRNAFLGPLSH